MLPHSRFSLEGSSWRTRDTPYCWGCDVEKVRSGFRTRLAANLVGKGPRSCNTILQGRSLRGDEPMSVITPFTCASATLRPPGGRRVEPRESLRSIYGWPGINSE